MPASAKNPSFRLTWRGVFLLGVGAALTISGVAFGVKTWLFVGFFAVLALLLDVVLLRFFQLKPTEVKVTRTFSKTYLTTGDTLAVKLKARTIDAFRLQPEFLEVKPYGRKIHARQIELYPEAKLQNYYSFDQTFEYRLLYLYRGVPYFESTQMLTDSLLACWDSKTIIENQNRLLVLPRIEDWRLGIPRTFGEGNSGKGGERVAHLDDATLREYQPGDSLRRVNWRSLAKTGKLLTRDEEPSPATHAWVEIRLPKKPAGRSSPDELTESMLNAAATFVAKLGNAGFQVEMSLEGKSFVGESEALLNWLACFDSAELEYMRSSNISFPEQTEQPSNPGVGPSLMLTTGEDSSKLPSIIRGANGRSATCLRMVFSNDSPGANLDSDSETVPQVELVSGWVSVGISAAATLDDIKDHFQKAFSLGGGVR
jgi:hypothetical protein